jgi:hypothetical protein
MYDKVEKSLRKGVALEPIDGMVGVAVVWNFLLEGRILEEVT